MNIQEGIAVGRSFAIYKNYHIDGNKEMIAIGMMNIAGSCTSCYLTTGPFSRTVVNFNAGCKTAVSNIVMATAVMITLLFLTPLFHYTPIVVLSAIIMAAMITLIDIEAAIQLWAVDKFDFIVCLSAYIGVVSGSVKIGLVIARAETSAGTDDWFSQPHFPLIEVKSHQSEMWGSELGAHTIRSHGVTVARKHVHDWLILILLGMILLVLIIIHPFYRFVGKDMMSDLKYPLKSNTVPSWAVPIYSVLLPIVVFLFFYLRRRDVYDLHHAILGLLFSVVITGVLTDAIKDSVGRPRPDFFWRCFPDGKDAYDQWGNVVCHGDKNLIRIGHKSFPSGHTSWSFAGLGFLALFLSGKIKVFDRRGHVAKLCIVLFPLLVASLVGISRVDDYRHHWQDVFAGGLLGLVIATFCYLQFFPPPYHVDGCRTYAYLQMLEESRPNSDNVQSSERGIEIQPNERNKNSAMGSSSSLYSSLPVQDLESGRR